MNINYRLHLLIEAIFNFRRERCVEVFRNPKFAPGPAQFSSHRSTSNGDKASNGYSATRWPSQAARICSWDCMRSRRGFGLRTRMNIRASELDTIRCRA